MGKSQSKINGKRQREDVKTDEVHERKIQCVSPVSPVPHPALLFDSTQSMTKITDLNDDCLTKIFGYLNLPNLLNVAVSNEWLRPAANLVYRHRFGKNRIKINGIDSIEGDLNIKQIEIWRSFQLSSIKWQSSHIVTNGLKVALQMLRCFGESITNLDIDYGKAKRKPCQHLDHYINRYCAKTLAKIKLTSRSNHSSNDLFEKPYFRVRHVIIENSDLGKQLPLFNKCFPNLRDLELFYVSGTKGFDQVSFGLLRHICIHENDYERFGLGLLHSNHQLKSLEIKFHLLRMKMVNFLDIIKVQSALTKLDVMINSDLWEALNLQVLKRLIDEHPSLIVLDLRRYKLNVNDNNAMIRLINEHRSLQELRFQIPNSSNYTKLASKLTKNQWHIRNVRCAKQYQYFDLLKHN